MLLLTAAGAAGKAGRNVLTPHQHNHTAEEGRRGGGCYIRHHHPTATPAGQWEKR